ncbi:MAG: hypothetical protein U9P36_03290, partial [Thermodesulfobacteriota bacterium]|nr:hypothetical protein [Thermodesulfobacteriota bacterium]
GCIGLPSVNTLQIVREQIVSKLLLKFHMLRCMEQSVHEICGLSSVEKVPDLTDKCSDNF